MPTFGALRLAANAPYADWMVRNDSGHYRHRGSLQLLASLNTPGTLSRPQMD